MKVKYIEHNERSSYDDPCELSDYEIELLDKLGIDEVIYWYAAGGYEGRGDLLFRRDNKWHHKDLSHCSCFGPLDGIEDEIGYATIEELLGEMSLELRERIENILLKE